MNELIVGKEYEVTHSRKGKFLIQINAIDATWVHGVITGGMAGAMMEYNERFEGEEVTVRKSFCKFKEIKN